MIIMEILLAVDMPCLTDSDSAEPGAPGPTSTDLPAVNPGPGQRRRFFPWQTQMRI